MEFKVPAMMKGSPPSPSSVTSSRSQNQQYFMANKKIDTILHSNNSADALTVAHEHFGAFCRNAWSCKFCQLSGMTSVMMAHSEVAHYEGAFCSTPACCKFCQVNGFVTRHN